MSLSLNLRDAVKVTGKNLQIPERICSSTKVSGSYSPHLVWLITGQDNQRNGVFRGRKRGLETAAIVHALTYRIRYSLG